MFDFVDNYTLTVKGSNKVNIYTCQIIRAIFFCAFLNKLHQPLIKSQSSGTLHITFRRVICKLKTIFKKINAHFIKQLFNQSIFETNWYV